MRHTYECPLRWADMDMLGHVNNVTYVDYLQEARIDMFAAHPQFRGGGDLAEGVVVVRHEVEFLAPLTFRRRPVLVDAWITQVRASSFTMAYEVYDEQESGTGPGGRTVFLRASSVLAPFVFESEWPRRITTEEKAVLTRYLEPAEPRARLERVGEPRHHYPLHVRWSDVDAYRHVNNVKYFEYFQESRIQYLMDLHTQGEEWSSHVVARIDVDYRRPMLFRLPPYELRSWISSVGTRSFVISAEVRDPLAAGDGGPGSGGELLASAQVVMVTFDSTTQRAAAMADGQRRKLEAELRGQDG
jgi:acyl-CoA thioester hydrolase